VPKSCLVTELTNHSLLCLCQATGVAPSAVRENETKKGTGKVFAVTLIRLSIAISFQKLNGTKYKSAASLSFKYFWTTTHYLLVIPPPLFLQVVNMATKNPGCGDSASRHSICTVPIMYLAHEDWSPRFESTFYTVKMNGYELYNNKSSLPHSSSPSSLAFSSSSAAIGGKTNFPAYYYKISVFCGHQSRTVLRRFSQFEWLYQNLPPSITHYDEPLMLPPKTSCICQPQTDSFAQNRMEQLQDFLRDVLIRRGAAEHDAVAIFLELETFVVPSN
jgi:hypothetical protein